MYRFGTMCASNENPAKPKPLITNRQQVLTSFPPYYCTEGTALGAPIAAPTVEICPLVKSRGGFAAPSVLARAAGGRGGETACELIH
jgi:hypothetical protein